MCVKKMECHGSEVVHRYLHSAIGMSYPVAIRIHYCAEFEARRRFCEHRLYPFHILFTRFRGHATKQKVVFRPQILNLRIRSKYLLNTCSRRAVDIVYADQAIGFFNEIFYPRYIECLSFEDELIIQSW